MSVEIRIYLFRDAVVFVEWTNSKFAKSTNTILFPETMKDDVKRYIHKYLQRNLNQVCNKMMLDDGVEFLSIDSWSGFS